MEPNRDATLERRRERNRLAQRRFRERHNSQNKSVPLEFITIPNGLAGLETETTLFAGMELGGGSFDPTLADINFDPFEAASTTSTTTAAAAAAAAARAILPPLHLPHHPPDGPVTGGATATAAGGGHGSGLATPPSTITTITSLCSPLMGSISSESERHSSSAHSASAHSSEPPQQDPGWLTPLHIAAHKGHVKIVQLLVQQNPDGRNDKDSDGMTPLMLAVLGGHEDVASVLLLKGARVPDTDRQGRSSLHLAVEQGHESMLRLLLDHCQGGLNAAVNAYDGNGRTPLHIAATVGFEAGVEMLLRFGANQGLKTPKRHGI